VVHFEKPQGLVQRSRYLREHVRRCRITGSISDLNRASVSKVRSLLMARVCAPSGCNVNRSFRIGSTPRPSCRCPALPGHAATRCSASRSAISGGLDSAGARFDCPANGERTRPTDQPGVSRPQ
jgi:hypothetical protein